MRIKKNEVEASKYFKLAADKVIVEAMIDYADMLKKKKGEGTVKNNAKSRRYYKMADDHKDTN